MDSGSVLDYVVDKNQVPPIDQKRIVAFINHFVVNTAGFLNKFAVNCETKFIDFESKLQKIEASLAILEAKLASIPGLEPSSKPPSTTTTNLSETPSDSQPATDTVDRSPSEESKLSTSAAHQHEINTNASSDGSPSGIHTNGVKVSEDVRFKKYFKMLQVGVPAPGVKMKMESEGLDSRMLDDPNRILEDGVREPAEE